METITVPRDITDAAETLAGLDCLITARKWERAAIVAAFTHDGGTPGPKPAQNRDAPGQRGGDGGVRGKSTAISCREFADLGIVGLCSDRTVRNYRRAWEWAKLPVPAPGAVVSLPLCEFPSTAELWAEGEAGESGESHARPVPEWNSDSWWAIIDARREDEPGRANDVNRWVSDLRAAARVLSEHSAVWSLLDDKDLRVIRAVITMLKKASADAKAASRERHEKGQPRERQRAA